MMALKAAPIWVCAKYSCTQLAFADLGAWRSGSGSNLRFDLDKIRKWECCLGGGGGGLTQRAKTPVEDEKPMTPGLDDAPVENDQTNVTESRGFHKDLNSLPRTLSSTDPFCSPSDGSKMHVAYQGAPGAYSEAAALKAYPKCETVPCDQFEATFKAVELWLVDKAVLPIENSVDGSIHRNHDLLLCHRLHIAVAQCEMTLNRLGVVKVNADNTAGATQIVASDGLRSTGAVASARAAEIYGLDILTKRIQDDCDNITRFWILAREPIIPGTTSIVFTLEGGPGVLFKALAVFALRGINLTKLESRPQRKDPLRVIDESNKGSGKYFEYLFFIDFEASTAEPRAQYAMGHLQEFAIFIRVLRCYPVDIAQ